MATSRSNPIVVENLKPGTLSWLPERQRFTPGTSSWSADRLLPAPDTSPGEDYLLVGHYKGDDRDRDSGRCAAIEGWCSHPGVQAGDTLQIFVSTAPAGESMLDVYRMGYYQRTGARQVLSAGPISGTAQPVPSPDAQRLHACAWTPSYEVTIPADWLSGVYLGKLTRIDDGTENYIVFVVRDAREADLIASTSDFTWQAYNGWPADYSLYRDGTPEPNYGTNLAVSFDRPYLPDWSTAIPGAGQYFVFEYPFTYWLEKMGYDVTYCSNLDTHLGTAALSRAAGFLSIGHDEYWTIEMYDNLRAAVDAGASIGFFSGNIANYAIGLRPGASGRPDRVFSRIDRFGEPGVLERYPPDHPIGNIARNQWPVPGKAPAEGQLVGAGNELPSSGCADWACSLPGHWIFEGTGMAEGDAIPNLVGHEWQGLLADIDGLEVVSRGATHDPSVGPGEYIATVYPGPHGNVVFNASTCWWATGLALPPGFQRPHWQGMPSARPDARVQRITENVLSRMLRARA